MPPISLSSDSGLVSRELCNFITKGAYTYSSSNTKYIWMIHTGAKNICFSAYRNIIIINVYIWIPILCQITQGCLQYTVELNGYNTLTRYVKNRENNRCLTYSIYAPGILNFKPPACCVPKHYCICVILIQGGKNLYQIIYHN